ncbi:ATP-binding cassette domain-containing protein [Ornithinibacillus sp. L9]|uniref:ATP-binding cassette domain-containing protein n=1 Tax=Ornithinibacillus caprae TaxID=2678566 RepID=A0A6N8FD90_9BACI|nr:ABC transporter ATP-binding protein [Ornithinibacillus caprae]MUK87513.1 ATP-binding cassette domain-containing protein [Ornithinibacillus caprae]
MNLLEVKNLHTSFYTDHGVIPALTGVSFSVKKGEVLGIVGESGCGKSVTSLSILQLLGNKGKINSGSIHFKGQDLTTFSTKKMRKVRGNEISMIFQEPLTSLNPLIRVGKQIEETVLLHKEELSKIEARNHAINMMKMVGIPQAEEKYAYYPHQLSGGMRQRIMIAIALACDPELLIADEPTTALDVTIQEQILGLMKKITRELDTSIILITHDLGVVAEMVDRVVVMYSGQVVEENEVEKFFANPKHPYSKGLIRSTPSIDQEDNLESIKGSVPTPANKPSGCPFHPRCPFAMEICKSQAPENMYYGEEEMVNCWLYKEEVKTS